MVTWYSIAEEHRNLVLEVECLMKNTAIYSVGDAQRTGCLSSETLIWRQISLNITNKGKIRHKTFKKLDKGMTTYFIDGCQE